MAFFKNFLIMIFLVGTLVASENNDIIYLHNGTVHTDSISSVNKHGLTLQDSAFCSFVVIEKIETSNSSIVREIEKIFPDIKVSKLGSLYILDFEASNIINIERTDLSFSKQFSFQMLSQVQSPSLYEIRFTFEPTNIENFIYELTYFLKFEKYDDYQSFLDKLLKFSIGAGYNINNSNFGASFLLKYFPLGKSIDEYLYFSTNFRTNLYDKMFFIITYDHFFKDIEIKKEKTRDNFSFGLGINL